MCACVCELECMCVYVVSALVCAVCGSRPNGVSAARSATHTTWASSLYVDTVRRKVPTNPRLSNGTRSGWNATIYKQRMEI